MNAQIFLYTSSTLLQTLNKDRQTSISELPTGLRISLFLKGELGIKDGEERPLSNEEVEKLLDHHKHFKPFFEAKELLPIKESEDGE